MNTTQKPTSQHQNDTLPQNGSSLQPNALGNQYWTPASTPNTTPPMTTLWKCATRNRLLCTTKSAGGTASSTPVRPPITKVGMKPTTQMNGTSKRICPRYMVNSQLNTFAPVGIEMIMLAMPKKALTVGPAPMVKKWCSQTSQDTRAITIVA